jgi:hypothetical protein
VVATAAGGCGCGWLAICPVYVSGPTQANMVIARSQISGCATAHVTSNYKLLLSSVVGPVLVIDWLATTRQDRKVVKCVIPPANEDPHKCNKGLSYSCASGGLDADCASNVLPDLCNVCGLHSITPITHCGEPQNRKTTPNSLNLQELPNTPRNSTSTSGGRRANRTDTALRRAPLAMTTDQNLHYSIM